MLNRRSLVQSLLALPLVRLLPARIGKSSLVGGLDLAVKDKPYVRSEPIHGPLDAKKSYGLYERQLAAERIRGLFPDAGECDRCGMSFEIIGPWHPHSVIDSSVIIKPLCHVCYGNLRNPVDRWPYFERRLEEARISLGDETFAYLRHCIREQLSVEAWGFDHMFPEFRNEAMNAAKWNNRHEGNWTRIGRRETLNS